MDSTLSYPLQTIYTMKYILPILPLLLLAGCSPKPQPVADNTLYVSILPLRQLVTSIVGEDFPVEVLVPAGASPETFEPTARQIAALDRSALVFNVGLIDFEQNMLSRIGRAERIVDLSAGIDPIAGECSHPTAGPGHAHGIDPHIWTSPRELRIMARNAYEAIARKWPDSTKYRDRYLALDERLQQLDSLTAAEITRSGRPYFLIYHPALTYYARAYGIRQVAIEEQGKEPSPKRLSRLIELARRDGIRTVFYQTQFPASSVAVIASDIGARPVPIDPLAEDVTDNIRRITELIVAEP